MARPADAERRSRIRTAAPGDLRRIAALEAGAFADPWSETQLIDSLVGPYDHVLVAEDPAQDGGVVAYALFRLVAGEAELLRLAVSPRHQGHGWGRRLLAAVAAELERRGAASAHLEVRRDNPTAVALYEAAGWERVGTRPRYYPDGADALVYRLDLRG
ncbi:MAG TPA: ribosomal protein S18-alanine N-acetyltransferase [Thermoanaerobaculia bacterium]|nr:ribosomal protein S18-alanine N-acetyltransferase [Thermoanaerobaculia bacterium]